MAQVQRKDWVFLLILGLTWGSSFILMKKALLAMDGLTLGSLRIFISFVAFLPFVIYKRKHIDWSRAFKFATIGILGSGIPAYFFAIAQTQIDSSLAGLLNSLTPIFAFILGVLFYGSSFKSNKLIGLVLGILGASILIYRNSISLNVSLIFPLLVVISTILYGNNVNLIKKWFSDTKASIVSGVSFMFIGPFAFAHLLYSGAYNKIMASEHALLALSSVLILALLGTVVATILYFSLVKSTTPVFASSVAYLMPIVALIWGVIDGEGISLIQAGALGLIVGGIYLIRSLDN